MEGTREVEIVVSLHTFAFLIRSQTWNIQRFRFWMGGKVIERTKDIYGGLLVIYYHPR